MSKKSKEKTPMYDDINPTTELTRINSSPKSKANWQPVMESSVSRAVVLFLIAAAILGIIIGRLAARFDEQATDAASISPVAVIEPMYHTL